MQPMLGFWLKVALTAREQTTKLLGEKGTFGERTENSWL
jgi:hypothetical protein